MNDGDATVSASGGAGGHSFLWDSGATNATLTNLPSGSYCVTATDANGCEDSTACVTLNNPAVISLPTSQNNIDCHGVADGDATANASGGAGGFSYQWDSFAGAQTSPTATGLAAGIYCVTVSDANTCTASTCVTITEPSAITVSNVTLNDPSCAGFNDGDATVNASGGVGGFDYLWDIAAAAQTTNTATGLAAGIYCVTVTDTNNCASNICVTITEPSALNLTANIISNYNGQDISCYGADDASIFALASGGTSFYNGTYPFIWSGPFGNLNSIDDGCNSPESCFDSLPPGQYIISTIDTFGCTASDTIIISEPDSITISLSGINSSCVSPTGSASTAIVGGTSSYNYLWNTAETTSSINGISGGTYCVSVTDLNACFNSSCINISSTGSISVSSSVVSDYNGSDISCNGASDAVVVVVPLTGSASISISVEYWSNYGYFIKYHSRIIFCYGY